MSSDLGTAFWALPEGAVPDESLQLIYASLYKGLLDEFSDVPGFGVLEQMSIERACFLYVHIRGKEMTNGFANDRAYKETLQLWTQMVVDLRKLKGAAVESDRIKDAILTTVDDTIQTVLNSMHPDVADGLRNKFADAFQEAKL